MARRIDVISMGLAGPLRLLPEAEAALAAADWVVGSAAQLRRLGPCRARQLRLPPLAQLPAWLGRRSGAVAVLATGDGLYYGIGASLARLMPDAPLHFHPNISSVQAACHRLGLAQQHVQVVSLHGRPRGLLLRALGPRKSLLVLSDRRSTPQVLARMVLDAGFGDAQMAVCERLGDGRRERVRRFAAAALPGARLRFAHPHISLIQTCPGDGDWPVFPGFADGFLPVSGTQFSKRHMRLAILSMLAPAAGMRVWDIGAGSGSVALELAWWADLQVWAVEQDAAMARRLVQVCKRFGVDGRVHLVQGRAPAALAGLPVPERVFIGGSDGELAALLPMVYGLLPAGGVLVASAVTEDSRSTLLDFRRRLCADEGPDTTARCESVQLAVAPLDALGGRDLYRPQLPVTLFRFRKP